ncbi:MAG: hypothetical protein ACLQDM_07340 [Bradyrhizobium sp.]
MRKVFLSILVAGVLAPSLAMAQATTTYVYRYQATGGATLPGVAQNPATLNFGLTAFYIRLAGDAGTKGKCALSSTGSSAFTKTNIGLIKKLVAVSGDTTYSDGTITTPSNGATGSINGFAWFSGFSGAAGLTNSGILNSTNSAAAGVICGGPASGSGTAVCGNGTLCKSGTLVSGDTNNLTDCSKAGSHADTSTPSTIAAKATNLPVFVYPLGLSNCTNPAQTYAECCSDPLLVIITSTHNTLSDQAHNGPSTIGTVDAQGDGGFSEAYAQ